MANNDFIGHNFLFTKVMSIKMSFWVELYKFFVLHDYHDIIFFVFIRKGVRHSPTFPKAYR